MLESLTRTKILLKLVTLRHQEVIVKLHNQIRVLLRSISPHAATWGNCWHKDAMLILKEAHAAERGDGVDYDKLTPPP